MTNKKSRKTQLDVVYSYDTNCLRATPEGRPRAKAKCVPLAFRAEEITIGTMIKNDNNKWHFVERARRSRRMTIRDIIQIAQTIWGSKNYVISRVQVLQSGEGYLFDPNKKYVDISKQPE